MNKADLLDKTARDGAERLLLARVLDKLEHTQRRNIPTNTGFLSPAEQAAVEGLLRTAGAPEHLFLGGYPGAERAVCVFLPQWQSKEDFEADSVLSALRCTFPEDTGLTHRDFLGAILGLGVTREKVGDLLVGPRSCDILVLPALADYLLLHLEGAGRVKLTCAPLALADLAPPPVKKKEIRDTVATLRLDAVAAAGFSLSRSKAAGAISAGKVQLNYRECVKPDHTVAQGDVISCRGLGKCVVAQAGGQSKKGRILITLERFC
ncbi:MAG: RNA-binding protein [Oscillospiraceae bacterium]|nr:RNA-binding protein [Oscillospiraceae bacterium]